MLITFADAMNILDEKKKFDDALDKYEDCKDLYFAKFNEYQKIIASGSQDPEAEVTAKSAVRKAKRALDDALETAREAKQKYLIAFDEAIAKQSNKKGKDKRKAAEKRDSINKAIRQANDWFNDEQIKILRETSDTESDTKEIKKAVDDKDLLKAKAKYAKLVQELEDMKQELSLLEPGDPRRSELRSDIRDLKNQIEELEDNDKYTGLSSKFQKQSEKAKTTSSEYYKDDKELNKKKKAGELESEIRDEIEELKKCKIQEGKAKVDRDTESEDQYHKKAETLQRKISNQLIKDLKPLLDSDSYQVIWDDFIAIRDGSNYVTTSNRRAFEETINSKLRELNSLMNTYVQACITRDTSQRKLEKTNAQTECNESKDSIDDLIQQLDTRYLSSMSEAQSSRYTKLQEKYNKIESTVKDLVAGVKSDETHDKALKSLAGTMSKEEEAEELINRTLDKPIYYVTWHDRPVTGYSSDEETTTDTWNNETSEYVIHVSTTTGQDVMTDVLWTLSKSDAQKYSSFLAEKTDGDSAVRTISSNQTTAKGKLLRMGQEMTDIPSLDDISTGTGSSRSGSTGYRSSKPVNTSNYEKIFGW